MTAFAFLTNELKKSLRKDFFVKDQFNASIFNALYKSWINEKNFCSKDDAGELRALYLVSVYKGLRFDENKLEQLMGYMKTVNKLIINSEKKKEIEAMCDGKVNFENLKELYSKWHFEPYYKTFGYRNKVLCGYIVTPLNSNPRYGVYVKKAEFYDPEEICEALKKYVANKKIHLEEYYKKQMAELDGLFNE